MSSVERPQHGSRSRLHGAFSRLCRVPGAHPASPGLWTCSCRPDCRPHTSSFVTAPTTAVLPSAEEGASVTRLRGAAVLTPGTRALGAHGPLLLPRLAALRLPNAGLPRGAGLTCRTERFPARGHPNAATPVVSQFPKSQGFTVTYKITNVKP